MSVVIKDVHRLRLLVGDGGDGISMDHADWADARIQGRGARPQGVPRTPKAIIPDASSPGWVFEGMGTVSAGASSRLLPDYPEPQRAEILDHLFKPKFGAGFQHLKVEIGSGENSTCGAEPSHVITRGELSDPKPRAYEFWLMAEARRRNPRIILDCLPWGYPRWVGDRFSQESADSFVAFLQAARKRYGLELNWISAAQNEMGTDCNWLEKNLRPTLDARGFSKIKLQTPDDDSELWQVFDTLEKSPGLIGSSTQSATTASTGANLGRSTSRLDETPRSRSSKNGTAYDSDHMINFRPGLNYEF